MIYMHQRIKDEALAQHSSIALPSVKKIKQATVLNNKSLVMSTGKVQSANRPSLPLDRLHSLSDFIGDIQSVATGKRVTGEALIDNALQNNAPLVYYLNSAKTAINVDAQRAAYEQAVQSGRFISYDMENLGGIDAVGANRFDYLTELAYTEGDMSNHSVETALGRTRQYLFGLSEKEYNALVEEISAPDFVYQSGRGKVLFDRLAIYGHKDTIIKGNKVLHEGKLPSGIPSLAEALEGARRLREAGMRDENTLRDGMTDGDRFKLEFMERAKDSVVAGHNILKFDNAKMGIMGHSMQDVQSLDTLAIYRAAAAHMPKKELLNIVDTLSQKTGFTQENLIELIVGKQDALTAHAAFADSALHSLIVSSPELNKVIYDYLPHSIATTELKPKQALFHINQNNYGDFKGLGFITLPTGETRTGSGFTFNENGITQDLFKTNPLKKGGLYTYEGSGKLKLTQATRDAMRYINADYAQESLHYVSLKAYNADGTLNADAVITQIFNSAEAMQEFIASNDLIGIKHTQTDDFVLPDGVLGEHAKQVMTRYNLNTQTAEALDFDAFIKERTHFSKTDGPSKKLKDARLRDARHAQHLIESVQPLLGDRSISEISHFGFSHDHKIALSMVDGSRIETEIGFEGLKEIIGHNRNKKQHLYYETVDNLIGQSAFFLRNHEVMQEVLSFVDAHYNGSTHSKEEAYRVLMQELLHEKIEAKDLTTHNLNYVEVLKKDIGVAKKTTPLMTGATSSDTLRINLDGGNAENTLIKTLMRHYYGKQAFTPADYNQQAIKLLSKFSDTMGLTNIDAMQYGDANMLSDTIIHALKQNKAYDLFYGILNKQSEDIDVLNHTIDPAHIKERLIKHSKHIKKAGVFDAAVLADRVISTFNEKIDERYFYQFGFEEKQARFMHQMHDRIIAEQRSFFTKVFKEFGSIPGMEFILEGKGFYAKYEDTVVDLGKYIPQYKVHGQMAYFQIGRSQVAANGVFFADSPTQFSMGSNVRRAAESIRFSYKGHRESVAQGYGDAANGIARVFSLFGNSLRESPDVGAKNMMNRNANFMVDFNQVLGLAGIMAKNGKIDVRNIEEISTLNRFSNDGQNAVNMSNTDQHYRSISRQHLDKMLYEMTKHKSEASLESFVAHNLGAYGTESYVNNGYANVGNPSHMAHYDLEDGKRLTAHQNNFYSFNNEEALETIAEIEKYHTGSAMPKYRIGAGVETDAGIYRTHTVLDNFLELDKYYSNQVVVKKAHTSPELFQYALHDYMNKKGVDEATRYKLSQVNLALDETVVDSRLKDSFFTQNEVQKISLTKDFVEDDAFVALHQKLNYKLSTNDAGNVVFKYGDSVDVRKHDRLFEIDGYQDTVDTTLSRYDGHLKLGFYAGQENLFLTEKDINKLIENKSLEDATAYLETLEAYFYVERSDQEMFAKLNASNVEKSKSRAIIYTPGEYNPEVAKRLSAIGGDDLIGSKERWTYIAQRLSDLNASDELKTMILEERHFANDVIQHAFGNKGIGIFTAENTGKHRGGGGYVNDILRTIQGYHLDNAIDLEIMQENLKDAVGHFDLTEDGTLVFANGASHANITKLREAVKKHYSFLSEETMGESLVVDGNLLATVFESNLAQTKENDMLSARMPIELLPQVQDYDDKIASIQDEIKQLKVLPKQSIDTASHYQKVFLEEQTIRHHKLFETIANSEAILREAQSKLSPDTYRANQQTLAFINDRLDAIHTSIAQYTTEIDSNIDQIMQNRLDYEPIQKLIVESGDKQNTIKALKAQKQVIQEEKRMHVATIDKQMQELIYEIQNIDGDIKMTHSDITITKRQETVLVRKHKAKSHQLGKAHKELARQKQAIQETYNNDLSNLNKQIQAVEHEVKAIRQAIEANEINAPSMNRALVDTNTQKREAVKRLKEEREQLINKRTEVKANLAKEKPLMRDANKAQRVVDANLHYQDVKMEQATKQASIAARHATKKHVSDTLDASKKQRAELLKNLHKELQVAQDAKLRQIIAYEAKAKGVKRDDRKFAFLRNIKYDTKVLQSMPKEMLDLLEIGDLDKLDYDNKPILKHVVDNMMNEALTSSRYNLLTPQTANSVIDKFTTNTTIRTGLKNIYANSDIEEISLEMIEAKYVISQMGAAREFNENRATIDELKSRGFEVLDIREYTQAFSEDAAFIQEGNSIFSKDLILDTGDNKYVAMPYLPSSTHGESIVQRHYERNIVNLRDLVFERDAIQRDNENIDSVTQKINDATDRIIRDNLNIVSKDGPIRDRLSARSNQSVRAASSSLDDLLLPYAEDEKIHQENIADASRALFRGKSIKDWAMSESDAAYIDAAWGSKEVFAGLGITDAYLEKEFGSAAEGWDYLATEGLQGFITRDPVLEKGSYKAGRLYFSDNLKGNSIKTTRHTQVSLAGDHDGDTNGFDVARWKINGRMQNSMQLRNTHDPLVSAMLNEIDTVMGINASTVNVRLAAEIKSAYQNKDLVQQNERYIQSAKENYEALLGNQFGDTLISEHLTNPYFDLGEERIKEVQASVARLETLTTVDYKNLNNTYDAIMALEGISEDERQMFVDDFKVQASLLRRQNTADTKTFKNAIGEVNLKLYEMRSQSETLMHYNQLTSAQNDAISEMTYALEQEVISSKNTRGLIDVNATHDLNRIFRAAYSGQKIKLSGYEEMNAADAMGVFIDERIGKDLFEEKYANRTVTSLDNTYEASKQAIQRSLSFYQDKRLHGTRDYFRLFTRNANTMHFSNSAEAEKGAQAFDGLRGALYRLADPFGQEADHFNMNDVFGDNTTLTNTMVDKELVDTIAAEANERIIRQNNMLNAINHNRLRPTNAMAGLAIAGVGAYMLIGAVGNSVTANTTNQAEQFQGDTLSDYGSTYSHEEQASQTQSSGYVVNINAKTNPQNVEKIAGQFNQSIAQSVNANLTMTLNVNESPMKPFQINQMIERGLFG